MTRLNLAAAAGAARSSLYLVRSRTSRAACSPSSTSAQSEERALDTDRERLKAERRPGDAAARREAAREKLAMRTATPAITQYVDAADGGVRAGGAAARRDEPRQDAGREGARAAPARAASATPPARCWRRKTPPWRRKFLVALVGLGFLRAGRPRRLRADRRQRLLPASRARSATPARSSCRPTAAASSTATA